MEKRVMIVGGNEGRRAGLLAGVLAVANMAMVGMGFGRPRGEGAPSLSAPGFGDYLPNRYRVKRHHRHQGPQECDRRLGQIRRGTHGADFMHYRTATA